MITDAAFFLVLL